MTELRDLSQLPSDPAYWDGLEARIMAGLEPAAGDEAADAPGLMAPFAARAWGLGGLALAAGLATLLLLPAMTPDQPASPTLLLRPPREGAALARLIASPSPPPLAALLVSPTEDPR